MAQLEEAAIFTTQLVVSCVWLVYILVFGFHGYFLQGGRRIHQASFEAAPYRRAFELIVVGAAMSGGLLSTHQWLGRDNVAEFFIDNPTSLTFDPATSVNGVFGATVEFNLTDEVNGNKVIDLVGWTF